MLKKYSKSILKILATALLFLPIHERLMPMIEVGNTEALLSYGIISLCLGFIVIRNILIILFLPFIAMRKYDRRNYYHRDHYSM